jgi:membrane-associated phospholipid phosphatase
MIKTIPACFIFLFLFVQVYAQNDTTRQNDTAIVKVAAADSVSIDTINTVNTFRATDIDIRIDPVKKQPVYKLKPFVDIPITAIGTAWSLYAFSKIYSKPKSDEEKILSLDRNNVNAFDRKAIRPLSKHLDKISYIPFNASMPMPLAFLIMKRTRKDIAKLTFLYLEAMSITGFLYTGAVYVNNRYRPYAYSPETPMDQRRGGGAKNSFYAGHPALVATSTFFAAKVFADYYPESKIKWLLYTLAGATTFTTAYLRYRAGQHFPTDLMLGVAQGTLAGILVPHFHKHKITKDPNLSLIPYGTGLALVYRLK